MVIDKDGKKVLLLIGNIKTLFKVLDSFENPSIDFSLFKAKLEETVNKKVSRKYAEGYFYSATVFGLLVSEGSRGNYRLSATAELLCSLYDNSQKESEYRMILSNLILANKRKGDLFRQFLGFVEFPRTEAEICKKFGEVTGKSLAAWSIESGLVTEAFGLIGKSKLGPQPKQPTLEEFNAELRSAYLQMQATGIFGMKRIFVPIQELRTRVSCKMGLPTLQTFDEFLGMLLDSELGVDISLQGGPSHALEEKGKDLFNYKSRLYLYLSIRS
jgi:hypothetical protein